MAKLHSASPREITSPFTREIISVLHSKACNNLYILHADPCNKSYIQTDPITIPCSLARAGNKVTIIDDNLLETI